jgi:hypothetical protein
MHLVIVGTTTIYFDSIFVYIKRILGKSKKLRGDIGRQI